MKRLLIVLLFMIPCPASAIIIRDDVDDARYRIAASRFPALVDLPGEGHGVLIAPRWVLTAAHAVSWQMSIDAVTINGTPRAVARVIRYPGYKKLPQQIIDEELANGDPTPGIQFLSAQNDIALVELADAVKDVTPAILYKGTHEQGHVVEIIGKGATGTGLTGMAADASHRTILRHAFTTITDVQDRWICSTFQRPPAALPLQGTTASGDSGSPVLLDVDGQQQVAGLASWQFVQGDARTFRVGTYGQIAYSVRVSHYISWIDDVIAQASHEAADASHGTPKDEPER